MSTEYSHDNVHNIHTIHLFVLQIFLDVTHIQYSILNINFGVRNLFGSILRELAVHLLGIIRFWNQMNPSHLKFLSNHALEHLSTLCGAPILDSIQDLNFWLGIQTKMQL